MSIVLRAGDEPVSSRMDYWKHVIGESVAPLDFRFPDGPDFSCSVVSGDAGPTRVTEISAGDQACVERTAKLIRSSPDLCKVDVMLQGSAVIEQGGREARLEAGDFTFVDLSRPTRWAFSPSRVVAVVFPRTLLPLPPGDLGRLAGIRVPGRDGAGALILSLAGRLPQQLGDYGTVDAARLGVAVVDVLSVALATQLDCGRRVPVETRQRALLLSVHRCIEERLGEPNLSPAVVAAVHHVSVRYLYRLFERQGTSVAGWIRHRRLERCRRDLLDPAQCGRSVASIGARWGFADPAHFSRVFRAAYGLPPGEYRLAGYEAGPRDVLPEPARLQRSVIGPVIDDDDHAGRVAVPPAGP